MALFVDGPASTAGDLAVIDGGLLDTAASHAINISDKIQLAHEILASDIGLWLERINTPGRQVPGYRLGQVVTTDAIRQWEKMQALALTYRDAWFAELAERYRVRWDEYSRLSREAYERFVASGLALVLDPLSKAPAPTLSSFAGPQRGGYFYAAVAWTNAAGQEGAASDASPLTIPDGQILVVSTGPGPQNAAGFNVYVGLAPDALIRRNDVAVPLGSQFTYIPGSNALNIRAGSGQTPDFIYPLRRILLRG